MRHVECLGQFGLEFSHVRPKHEATGVADPADRGADGVTEHGLLPVEGQQGHRGQEAFVAGGGCGGGGRGAADHGAVDSNGRRGIAEQVAAVSGRTLRRFVIVTFVHVAPLVPSNLRSPPRAAGGQSHAARDAGNR